MLYHFHGPWLKKKPSTRRNNWFYPPQSQTDASDNAVGGALLQPNNDGKLQPVAFMSSSMNPTEQRYSQIEKECLAICNCFQRFDQWLYGKPDFEVHTDHKPLETIIKKPLNKAPTRLQRMLMRLQRYEFTVKYKRGPTLPSRHTLSSSPTPSNNSTSTGLWCFQNGDGVRLQRKKSEANWEHRKPATWGN